jgi:threonylcarbamoyladenosine tRNA methylthiotransferase MtaB
MKKFIITTLGCKVNQYESESLARSLKDAGWESPEEGESADICIINTCTVTQKAAMQSRQLIRQAIRSHPRARIVVTGCYAQTEPDAIQKIKGVHEIVGHKDKHKLGKWKMEKGEWKMEEAEQSGVPFPVSAFRTRPFLKIQDGCNAFCTYCIVPYARGQSRSMPPDEVLENILRLKAAGFHEVVLSGIHLGSYGLDLSPPIRFHDLLRRICDSNAIDRVRLSSIEPNEITEEIISLAAESDILCRHFHIPLQSGDDTILKQMHRPYTTGFFTDLITEIHDRIPDAAIGVDTLIGFPGETKAAFENTCKTIETLPVAYLHVFPFSSRKGTPASTYSDKIPPELIKARCQKMRDLGISKRREFYKKVVGRTVEILVEETRDKSTGLLKGMTSNYIPVLISGKDDLKNTFIKVKVEKIDGNNSVFGIED